MGKRSSFERVERDFYPTPYSAVVPLLPFLRKQTRFIEPCAGEGDLIAHLMLHGHVCVTGFDKYPDGPDATTHRYSVRAGDVFITNPPWDRKILHPLIDNLRVQAPTWLLFDADWMHTRQAAPYLKYCSDIVSVGRVKWIPDSPHTGKDNCCWYKFGWDTAITRFHGRN